MMAGAVRRTREGKGGGGRRDRARDTRERTADGLAVGNGMPTEPVALVVSLAERGHLSGGLFSLSPTSLVRGLAWGGGRGSRRRRTDRWTDEQEIGGEQRGVSAGRGGAEKGRRRRAVAMASCNTKARQRQQFSVNGDHRLQDRRHP